MALTEQQRVALAVLPKIGSIPSLICSALIIYSIMRDPKRRTQIHYRLMIGFSIYDVIGDVGFFLSTWPIPADASAMYAAGNEVTCVAQGFVMQQTIVPSLYNVIMAIYYLLVLRYGWTERQIRPYEPLLQGFPPLWGVCTGCMAIVLRLFNNANFWCWVAAFPAGCEGDDCLRGRNANRYRWMFYYGPLWASIIFVTGAMVLIYTHIWRQSQEEEGASKEKLVAGQKAPEQAAVDRSRHVQWLVNDDNGPSDDIQTHIQQRDAFLAAPQSPEAIAAVKRKLLRRNMAIQCAMYTVSFYLVYVSLTLVRVLQTIEKPIPYWLLVGATAMTPMQGVFNFFTFIFPRFFAAKADAPHAGAWRWLKAAI